MATIAFVGCAHVHAPEFAEMAASGERARVKLAWDPEPARADQVAELTGARVAGGRDSIWEDAEIEGVAICSETADHAELVASGLAAGKALFVEKPLSSDATEARRLAAEIEDAGVVFQTGFFMRSLGAHIGLRELISSGGLGTVTRLRINYSHQGVLEGWFDEPARRWTADPALAGIGGYGDEALHGIDLALWLFGHPAVEAATGAIATPVGRYGEIDELGEGLLQLTGGTIVTVGAGWADREARTSVEAFGTRGWARVEEGALTTSLDRESVEEDLPHAFELFCDALNGEQVPLVRPTEAALATTILSAIYSGARDREWVDVP